MTKASNDAKFIALHKHYNNTFVNIKESIKLRDRLMVLILLVLGFMTLYIFWPPDAMAVFSQISTQKLGLAINIDKGFLGSIIWFVLLIMIVRYTQVVVYIERQYAYINRLEKKLHSFFDDGITFTREGKSYLEEYPKFLNWVWILYMIIFPSLLIFIVLFKIIEEWLDSYSAITTPLIFNTIIAFCILVSVILYMIFMHRQNN